MAPPKSHYFRALSEAVQRADARTTQKKTAEDVLRRELLASTGQRDTGQSLADLRAAVRGTYASPESPGFHAAFGGNRSVQSAQRPAAAPQPRQPNGGGVDVSAAKRMTDAATAAAAAAGIAGVLPSAATAMSWRGIPEAATATAQQPVEPQPTSRMTLDGQRETLDEKTGRYVGSIANPPPRTDLPATASDGLARADMNSPRIQGLLDAAAGIKRADPNTTITGADERMAIAQKYGDEATKQSGGTIAYRPGDKSPGYAGDGSDLPGNAAIAAGDPDMKKAPAAGRSASSVAATDYTADPATKKAPAAGRSASSVTAAAMSAPHAAVTPTGKIVDASNPTQARELSIKNQVTTMPDRITPPDMRPRAEREASNEAARQSAARNQIANPGLRTEGAWDALTKGNLSETGSHLANNFEAGWRGVAGAAGDLLDQGGASGSPLVTALQNAGRTVVSEGPNISPETVERYADARHAQTGMIANTDPKKKKRFALLGR